MMMPQQQPQQPQIPDGLIAQGAMAANQIMGQQLQGIVQLWQQAAQIVKAKTPPPQLPPEVQGQVQIAQAETQRKAQLDQAQLQLDQAKFGAQQQMEQMRAQLDQGLQQARLQIEQAAAQVQAQAQAANSQVENMRVQMENERVVAREQFQQQIEMARIAQEKERASLQAQVDMAKNDADNRQKQMTELLKNHEDNQTNLVIAQMKEQMASQAQVFQAKMDAQTQAMQMMQQSQQAKQAESDKAAKQPAIDLAPQVKQIEDLLTKLQREKMDNALGTVVEGLKTAITTMGAPKRIMRDGDGKAIGIMGVTQ